jgi:hypothetical protein
VLNPVPGPQDSPPPSRVDSRLHTLVRSPQESRQCNLRCSLL